MLSSGSHGFVSGKGSTMGARFVLGWRLTPRRIDKTNVQLLTQNVFTYTQIYFPIKIAEWAADSILSLRPPASTGKFSAWGSCRRGSMVMTLTGSPVFASLMVSPLSFSSSFRGVSRPQLQSKEKKAWPG